MVTQTLQTVKLVQLLGTACSRMFMVEKFNVLNKLDDNF